MAKNPLMDAIRRLRISNGDVLVIDKNMVSEEGMHAISARLDQMGKTQVLILGVNDINKVASLNETTMNSLGWFRARNIIPLRNKKQNTSNEGEKRVVDEPI